MKKSIIITTLVASALLLRMTGDHTAQAQTTTPSYLTTSQVGWINVKSMGCKVDGVTDDTACWNAVAANLSGKTYYLPAGTGCSIINGFINIGSPTYLPGSFRIVGAAKGGLGSCIQQNTDAQGVFQFVRELTNSFDIEYINFTAKNHQTAATSENADTNATAILFNPTTHNAGGEFSFNISNNTFGNFARGIGVQKQVAAVGVVNPVWGFNIDNNICFGSLAGACINLVEGAPTGNPRCSFHGNYATNANTTEPQFSEAYCNALDFAGNESNNGLNTVADFYQSEGEVSRFHIETHTMTVVGTPVIAEFSSNMVNSDIDISSHVCSTGTACQGATNPIIYGISNSAGGGSVTADYLSFTAYGDSDGTYIANAVRVGGNTLYGGNRIGVTRGWTNILQPGDASNSLFTSVGPTLNVTFPTSFPYNLTTTPTCVNQDVGVSGAALTLPSCPTGVTYFVFNYSSSVNAYFTATAGSANNQLIPPNTGATVVSAGGGNWYLASPLQPQFGTTGSIGGSALTAGQCSSGTATGFVSLTFAMDARATPTTYPGDGFWWEAYVTAGTTVTVKVCAAVAGTPTASTYNVRMNK